MSRRKNLDSCISLISLIYFQIDYKLTMDDKILGLYRICVGIGSVRAYSSLYLRKRVIGYGIGIDLYKNERQKMRYIRRYNKNR